jgi:hypothetical protein
MTTRKAYASDIWGEEVAVQMVQRSELRSFEVMLSAGAYGEPAVNARVDRLLRDVVASVP